MGNKRQHCQLLSVTAAAAVASVLSSRNAHLICWVKLLSQYILKHPQAAITLTLTTVQKHHQIPVIVIYFLSQPARYPTPSPSAQSVFSDYAVTISLAEHFTLTGSIQTPSAFNLAMVARLFHTTAIKRDQKRERERKCSLNQHPSWSDEKSTAHLCVWRSFTLAAANPELCIHSVCDTKPNRTLTSLRYIIELGNRLQYSLRDPSGS